MHRLINYSESSFNLPNRFARVSNSSKYEQRNDAQPDICEVGDRSLQLQVKSIIEMESERQTDK